MNVKKRTQRAFSLIELMFVVSIIGILAAIAIPAYRDFIIRTKVAELLAAAGALKGRVAENVQQSAGVLTGSGAGLTVTFTGKVTGGTVTDNGTITIEGSETTVGTAISIVLTPSVSSDGKVIWACSSTTAVFKYVPSDCRH